MSRRGWEAEAHRELHMTISQFDDLSGAKHSVAAPVPYLFSSLPVSWMVARFAFIPAFIVAGNTGHFLLLALEIQTAHILQKPFRLVAPKSRRAPTVMIDHHIAILRTPEGKTKIAHFALVV